MEAHERIVLTQAQVHGNISVVTEGELISIHGQEAVVSIDGEAAPRRVPLDALHSASDLYGATHTGRPNEPQVVDAIIRR